MFANLSDDFGHAFLADSAVAVARYCAANTEATRDMGHAPQG
jgi:hypothetical protein